MRNEMKAFALAIGILGMGSIALADEPPTQTQDMQMPGPMMQGEGMTGQDGMAGMMGMMTMMAQMGPMMERCDEMMSAMTDHPKLAPETPEDKG